MSLLTSLKNRRARVVTPLIFIKRKEEEVRQMIDTIPMSNINNLKAME